MLTKPIHNKYVYLRNAICPHFWSKGLIAAEGVMVGEMIELFESVNKNVEVFLLS